MPRLDLIDTKIAAVQKMVEAAQTGEKVILRLGGRTVINQDGEVSFQQSRIDNLNWAKTATDADIQAKINNLEGTLSSGILACKYGSVRGLTVDEITTIAQIEDLEIALGTHPAVQ